MKLDCLSSVAALLVLLSAASVLAQAPAIAPATAAALTARVAFDQRLGASVPRDSVFHDETGQPVALGYYLNGQRPAVLVLGYKDCPMLCSLVLSGLTETMTQMRLTTSRDFDLIDLSIDPHQTSADAAAQKRLYYKRYARPDAAAGWHFLTSQDDAAIHRLADAIGFRYAYEAATRQYAHPSGIVVLTPEGKISRYFFGVNFEAQELQDAIRAAGTNTVGSPIARLLLLCFHFNPASSKYGALIITCLRAAGVLTVVILCGGIALLIRGERSPRPTATL